MNQNYYQQHNKNLHMITTLFSLSLPPPHLFFPSTLLQWDPSTLEKVEAEKLNLVFQPFEEDWELKIPIREDSRLVCLP